MARMAIALAGLALLAGSAAARAAEPVMVQCGRDYQAARTAGTLNGADWNRYRADCAARLKAAPAAALAPPVSPAAAPTPVATAAPAAPASAVPAAAASGGMAAMHDRQKRCGAEWTSQKATLVAATPGLTWPHYWSLCNTRLKAAGG